MLKPVSIGPARHWNKLTRFTGWKTPSWRNRWGLRKNKPNVIAIGGNSFDGTKEIPKEVLRKSSARNCLQTFMKSKIVILHGNGPQIGELLEKYEEQKINIPLYEGVAETQTQMGEEFKDCILEEAARRGFSANVSVEIVPTRIIVDPEDPAFAVPTKPIGKYFDKEKIFHKLQKWENEKLYDWEENGITWVMKEVEENQFRRVVPSPKPLAVHPDDLKKIKKGLFNNKIVIAGGGGGVPISIDKNGKETKYEAVIDKDLAAALLSWQLKASKLIISTGVKYVANNYGEKDQTDVKYYWAKTALKYLKKGEYPAGSMGEKIEAGINALRGGVNSVLITDPDPNSSWESNQGTLMTRGIDWTGRLYGIWNWFKVNILKRDREIQRWMVS